MNHPSRNWRRRMKGAADTEAARLVSLFAGLHRIHMWDSEQTTVIARAAYISGFEAGRKSNRRTDMNATEFRIEEIQKVTINGVQRKLFKAFRKNGAAFVFMGQFSAPIKMANRDLWKVADAA